MLGWLFRQGRRRARIILRGTLGRLRAGYDAARTGPENERHWAAADALSARAANSASVRKTLRERCRYEVANNSLLAGIVSTLANDTIGTGPRLQVRTASRDADQRIEAAFARWCRQIELPAKLRTMRRARAVDGEAFGLLVTDRRLNSPVQLNLVLIEADQVATPDLAWEDGRRIDGLELDPLGRPRYYHVLEEHPGDPGIPSFSYRRVPADQVIHWFKAERPGQVRGIPELTPALPACAVLRRYVLAVLTAAEVAALPAGVLSTDAPPDGQTADVEPLDTVELDRGVLMTLPAGWRLEQVKAEQPKAEFAEFRREVINEIARCLDMPFNVAAANSSGYNYASGRLDHQTYHRSLRVAQSEIEHTILDRLWAAWLEEAALVPGLIPDGAGPIVDWDHWWMWDGTPHVDPLKEATAQQIRLQNHTTTLAEEYARRGLDWEQQLRQRAKELALAEELGLPLTWLQYTPVPPPEPAEE